MFIRNKSKIRRLIESPNTTEFCVQLSFSSMLLYILLNTIETKIPEIQTISFKFTFLFYLALVSLLLHLLFISNKDYEDEYLATNENIPTRYLISFIVFSLSAGFFIFKQLGTQPMAMPVALLSVVLIFFLLILNVKSINKLKTKKSKFSKYLNIFFSSTILIIILFVGWCYFVPNGTYTVSIDPQHLSQRVAAFPENEQSVLTRSTQKNNAKNYQITATSPLLFKIIVPRSFTSASAHITYMTNEPVGAIKFGAKIKSGSFIYVPVNAYNPMLENLPPFWQELTAGQFIIWQKNKKFEKAYLDSEKEYENKLDGLLDDYSAGKKSLEDKQKTGNLLLEEYLNNVKEIETRFQDAISQLKKIYKISSDNYPLEINNITYLKDAINQKNKKTFLLNTDGDNLFSLQSSSFPSDGSEYKQEQRVEGSYKLIGYTDINKKLTGFFNFFDNNRVAKRHSVTVIIRQNDLELERVNVDKIYSSKKVIINPVQLKKGLFHVDIITDGYLITQLIQLNIPNIGFAQQISPVSDVNTDVSAKVRNTPLTLYTNSTHVNFFASNQLGVQTVKLNSQNIHISNIAKPAEVNSLKGISKIYTPNSNIEISGDGVFTFDSKSPLLNLPIFTRKDIATLQNVASYDYIYAQYTKKESSQGWETVQATINKVLIPDSDNTLTFGFSFEELSKIPQEIHVKNITITCKKEPITFGKIIRKIHDLLTK